MAESTDFDAYDDDGFDEAFADLINRLEDVAVADTPVNSVELNKPRRPVSDHEHKLSHEAVCELTNRIQQTSTSPYDRFRSQRGTLSVTDLVSLDWCETQFLYTLEGGKKRKTNAMKRGHEIHKALENELHDTVTFTQITTEEEIWGLRFLNILFGLRELKIRGKTREFPIFGFVGNHLVIGIIDQIAYKPEKPIAKRPMDMFVNVRRKKEIIISDVKTRVTSSLPNARHLRGPEMQLSLYHQLVFGMINGEVGIKRLYSELALDAEGLFSDGFLAEAGNLYSTSGIISLDMLLENNSLDKLWQFVATELSFLQGCLSSEMEIEYRQQMTEQIIGLKSFKYNDEDVTSFIHHVLDWWDGNRTTTGVDIEEAYKCRTCEFEEGCSWRAAKMAELAQRRVKLRSNLYYKTAIPES